MALRLIQPPSVSGTGWSVQRRGGIVFLRFWGYSDRTLQLPAGYAPTESHSLPYRFGAIDVKADGSVTIITGSYNGSVYATVSYPTV